MSGENNDENGLLALVETGLTLGATPNSAIAPA
jgi:hypothetical protein